MSRVMKRNKSIDHLTSEMVRLFLVEQGQPPPFSLLPRRSVRVLGTLCLTRMDLGGDCAGSVRRGSQ